MTTPAQRIIDKLRLSGIPEYMQGGVERYILHGIPPGHFLSAILDNDLREACQRADMTNRVRIWEYVAFLYNYAPLGCWGYAGAVDDWCAHRGLDGPLLLTATSDEIDQRPPEAL